MGFMVVVMGLGMTFLVLAVLILLLRLLEVASKDKKSAALIEALPEIAAPAADTGEEARIAAVITAAVYSVLSAEQNNNNLGFTVRRIRRI